MGVSVSRSLDYKASRIGERGCRAKKGGRFYHTRPPSCYSIVEMTPNWRLTALRNQSYLLAFIVPSILILALAFRSSHDTLIPREGLEPRVCFFSLAWMST
jgi:hypothetical protein